MDTEDRVSLVYETRGAEQAVAEHTAVAAAQTKMADAQVRIGRTGSEAAEAHHKVREGLHAMAGALGFINPELDIFVHLMQSTKIAAFGISDALELVATGANAMWSAIANPVGLAIIGTILAIKAALELMADAQARAKENQDALNESLKAGMKIKDQIRDAEKKKEDKLVDTAKALREHGGDPKQAEETRKAAAEAVIGSGGRFSMKEALDTATNMAGIHRDKPITAAEINQFTGLGRDTPDKANDPEAARNIEEAQGEQKEQQAPEVMKKNEAGATSRYLRDKKKSLESLLKSGFIPSYEGEEQMPLTSRIFHPLDWERQSSSQMAKRAAAHEQINDLDKRISDADRESNKPSTQQHYQITNSIIYQREHPLIGPSPNVGPPSP